MGDVFDDCGLRFVQRWRRLPQNTPYFGGLPKSGALRQNGQILFISVEQLSLNVADDSAETLSVLENMGDALDACVLRFLEMCRRPPQKYPRFGGPTDFFKILPKKQPYRNHTKSMN